MSKPDDNPHVAGYHGLKKPPSMSPTTGHEAFQSVVTGSVDDMVNHPPHYTQSLNEHGIECIQAIEASMTGEQFIGFLKGQVMKYVWRMDYKGKAAEDLRKAQFYLNLLVDRAGKRDAQQRARDVHALR